MRGGVTDIESDVKDEVVDIQQPFYINQVNGFKDCDETYYRSIRRHWTMVLVSDGAHMSHFESKIPILNSHILKNA